tara:strand:+ start:1396 stop:2052 length:657 start_codon:yes stop_codon:yes gene_type:complete
MDSDYIHNYEAVIEAVNKFKEIKSKDIRLVVVTKNQDYEKIVQLEKCGQKDFGENYIDEAEKKIAKINNKNITWHYIGIIQSNKIRKMCKIFQWVHTVSSEKHASKINQICEELDKKINICIQINIDREKTKSGIIMDEFDDFSSLILKFKHLNLRGIMAIPAVDKSCENSFFRMKELFNKYSFLDTLSMGMSKDYIQAIENDANLLRIGQQIFGARE